MIFIREKPSSHRTSATSASFCDGKMWFLDISSARDYQIFMCSVPPHPYPLPKERESRYHGPSQSGSDQMKTAGCSPYTWVEGGEGERDRRKKTNLIGASVSYPPNLSRQKCSAC